MKADSAATLEAAPRAPRELVTQNSQKDFATLARFKKLRSKSIKSCEVNQSKVAEYFSSLFIFSIFAV